MRKILLLLTACISLLNAADTQAYTIDDIVNQCPYMISELKHQRASYRTGYYQNHYVNINVNVMRGYGVRLEKVDDTHLKFCGFEGKYDFVFTLTTTSGKEDANGTQLRINGMTANTNTDQTDNVEHFIYPIISTQISGGYYNWDRTAQLILTITKDNADNYVFGQYPSHTQSGRGYFVYKWQERTPADCASLIVDCTFAPPAHYAAIYTEYVNGYASDRFDDYKYDSSAAASESAPRGARRIRTEERNYPVLVNWNESANTFSIINFAAQGFGYTPTAKDFMEGTFNADGTCELCDAYLYYRCNYGTTYGETGFDGYYATRFVPKSNTIGTTKVQGTWEAVDVKHNAAKHHWVTNGGERRTIEGIEMSFDPFTLLNSANITNKYTKLKFDGGYFDTKILFGNDATADVELVLDDFGCSTSQVRVMGHIVTNKNDKYVDHYEVCVVPGKYSSIHHHDGFKDADAEHGHTSALNIHHPSYDYVKETATKVARVEAGAGSHDYSFDKIFDKSETGENANNDYTFYIKTVYRDEYPHLAPTFHSMKSIDAKPTGIEEIGSESTDAPAEYFNMQGMRVDTPTHGVYIRRRGNTSEKVVL